jgi:3-hydroxyisobutyrate dehydrogenase-like beta-hydroxyacid dehydrogenase
VNLAFARGVRRQDREADAARRAAIVVTMVTDADAVISIGRDQGMLAALAPGAIWAQMSTIGVAGIDRVAAMAGGERLRRQAAPAPPLEGRPQPGRQQQDPSPTTRIM